jgi:hypothetical protein
VIGMNKMLALVLATVALAAAFAPAAGARQGSDHGICICDPPPAVW